MYRCGITGHSGILGKSIQKNLNFNYIKFNGDITKIKEVEKWVSKNKFDYLIHLAAIVPTSIVERDFLKSKRVNYIGTKNLINSLIKYRKDIKFFFFSSTSHVYNSKNKFFRINEKSVTKPYSKYGKTKLLAENYIKKRLQKSKITFCIGRIFSIYDNTGKDFLIPNLLKKIDKKEKNLIFENLNHYRDFLSTLQISKIIIFLWKKKFQGIINIGSGFQTNIKTIVKKLASKSNKKIFFKDNKPTFLIADVSKLKKIGFKQKNLKLKGFF